MYMPGRSNMELGLQLKGAAGQVASAADLRLDARWRTRGGAEGGRVETTTAKPVPVRRKLLATVHRILAPVEARR